MKFNAANAQKVIDWIEANPERWDQEWWNLCFAGIANRMAGNNWSTVKALTKGAREFLGISYDQGRYLFHWERTLPEIKERIRLLAMEANGHE